MQERGGGGGGRVVQCVRLREKLGELCGLFWGRGVGGSPRSERERQRE